MSEKSFTWDFRGRRSIRVPGFDYSSPGTYGVTICAKNMDCIFGKVERKKMVLNDNGRIVKACWDELPGRFRCIARDIYIIMPNHFHGLIRILGVDDSRSPVGAGSPRPDQDIDPVGRCTGRGAETAPLLGTIVAWLKYKTTKRLNIRSATPGRQRWQRNYWESIINTDRQYDAAVEYILNNPAAWDRDEFNPARSTRLSSSC